MKGKNTIHINQATMVEAVQQYLDAQFATGNSPKVQVVKANADYDMGNSTAFVIETLAEGERDPKCQPEKGK